MRKYQGIFHGQPDCTVVSYNANCNFPSTCWSLDSFGLDSGGIGFGLPPITSALGEYFERRHFRSEVRHTALGRLGAHMDTQTLDAWTTALCQTGTTTPEVVESHAFHLTPVLDGARRIAYVPTAVIQGKELMHENDNGA